MASIEKIIGLADELIAEKEEKGEEKPCGIG